MPDPTPRLGPAAARPTPPPSVPDKSRPPSSSGPPVVARPAPRPAARAPTNQRPADRGSTARGPADGTPRRPAPDRGNTGRKNGGAAAGDKAEHEILFQKYFKSVGPRTYAAQVKRATNLNHYLVLTEGKRDDATGEVRKTRLFVFSEDFPQFFQMLRDAAHFIKDNPVPDDVKKKRQQFWARKSGQGPAGRKPARPAAPRAHPGTNVATPKPQRPIAARSRDSAPSTKGP